MYLTFILKQWYLWYITAIDVSTDCGQIPTSKPSKHTLKVLWITCKQRRKVAQCDVLQWNEQYCTYYVYYEQAWIHIKASFMHFYAILRLSAKQSSQPSSLESGLWAVLHILWIACIHFDHCIPILMTHAVNPPYYTYFMIQTVVGASIRQFTDRTGHYSH